MLNKNNERELAYVVMIDDITPIKGYDRVELAHIGGWTVVVGKGEFKPGDPAIYFEIDSQLPEVEPFTNMEFLAKKHYKVKTQKMCKSISQGLLMSAENFGWEPIYNIDGMGDIVAIKDSCGEYHYNGAHWYVNDESRFLTKQLGVTYAAPEDNARKANSPDKYKRMAQRHNKLFSHQPFRWLMKRNWGKKLLFFFFGNKKDGRKSDWPYWVKKTDEERIENLSFLFDDKKTVWIATEKIDGTSTTFTLKRGKGFKKDEFYICSRNVVFNKPDKNCFYDTNVYIEMAEKYNIFEKMTKLLHEHFTDCDWITIQGETYGEGIQKRDYSIKDHNFMAFNLITSKEGRFNSERMKTLLEEAFGIPCVPIVKTNYIIPDTLDEMREFVDSQTSVIDGEMREGIVFRSLDGTRSFKCVSPKYLLKYHQ
jgi:hypothetical protein